MTRINRPQDGEPDNGYHPSQTSLPYRILVVDDDADTRLLHTKALLRAGYEVEEAEDGAAAWEALSSDCYDLMITDNSMPKVSGIELLAKLRAARMILPVIMATGAIPKHEFTRYPWLQPAATLLKPYTNEVLLGAVKEVLRATEGAGEQFPPPPNRQNQPATGGRRL